MTLVLTVDLLSDVWVRDVRTLWDILNWSLKQGEQERGGTRGGPGVTCQGGIEGMIQDWAALRRDVCSKEHAWLGLWKVCGMHAYVCVECACE